MGAGRSDERDRSRSGERRLPELSRKRAKESCNSVRKPPSGAALAWRDTVRRVHFFWDNLSYQWNLRVLELRPR